MINESRPNRAVWHDPGGFAKPIYQPIDRFYLKCNKLKKSRYNTTKKVVEKTRNRIRDLREDHDYTQQQVAEAIGMTQRKYSYLETGIQQWTPEHLIKLSALYSVSIDYLLCQTDNPMRYNK